MKKFLSIYILSLIAISNVMAADEVKYTMVSKSELYEIRKYSDRLVIETETSNQNSGFRKLFKYISINPSLNLKSAWVNETQDGIWNGTFFEKKPNLNIHICSNMNNLTNIIREILLNQNVSIYWIRKDLRIHDNPALVASIENGVVLPIYILDDTNPGEHKLGSASRIWLHQSLEKLNFIFQLNSSEIFFELILYLKS